MSPEASKVSLTYYTLSRGSPNSANVLWLPQETSYFSEVWLCRANYISMKGCWGLVFWILMLASHIHSWGINLQQLPRSGRELSSRGRHWTSQLTSGGESSWSPRGLGHALLTDSITVFISLLHYLLCNSRNCQFHKIIKNHAGDQPLDWGDYFGWVDWSEKTTVGGTNPYTGLLDHNKRGKWAKHKPLWCSSWLRMQCEQLLHAPLWLPHHNGLKLQAKPKWSRETKTSL